MFCKPIDLITYFDIEGEFNITLITLMSANMYITYKVATCDTTQVAETNVSTDTSLVWLLFRSNESRTC